MLDSLTDQSIGTYHLHVEYVGRIRFFDQRDFELYLHTNNSSTLIFRGLYNAGRPSIYVPAWIDGEFIENSTAFTVPLAEALAEKLGAMIPPGGRLWLAYESFGEEGEMMRETRAGLLANVPLMTTPIGFLLYRADCWLGLRDWHFPEGGREGPRKLQGNKAVNTEHMRERAAEIAPELEKFSSASAQEEIAQRAQARAKIVLPAMKLVLES